MAEPAAGVPQALQQAAAAVAAASGARPFCTSVQRPAVQLAMPVLPVACESRSAVPVAQSAWAPVVEVLAPAGGGAEKPPKQDAKFTWTTEMEKKLLVVLTSDRYRQLEVTPLAGKEAAKWARVFDWLLEEEPYAFQIPQGHSVLTTGGLHARGTIVGSKAGKLKTSYGIARTIPSGGWKDTQEHRTKKAAQERALRQLEQSGLYALCRDAFEGKQGRLQGDLGMDDASGVPAAAPAPAGPSAAPFTESNGPATWDGRGRRVAKRPGEWAGTADKPDSSPKTGLAEVIAEEMKANKEHREHLGATLTNVNSVLASAQQMQQQIVGLLATALGQPQPPVGQPPQ